MSATITLRLQKDSVTTSMGAVATLQRVADERGVAVPYQTRLDVVVPANSSGVAENVTVDPGRWLIEATLPSGEVINEEVTVASGDQAPVVLRAAEHSPHEWLGWQYLVGNIEGADTLRALSRRSESRGTVRTTNTFEGQRPGDFSAKTVEFSVDTSGPAPEPDAEAPVVHVGEIQGGLRGPEAWVNVLKDGPQPTAPASPTWEDGDASTWLYMFPGPTQLPQRHAAHVAWLGERYVLSLPQPWPALRNGQLVPVEMMVRTHPLERTVQVAAVVRDTDFAAMSGLMTASTLPKAAVAVNQALGLLFGKALHPLGATAGAYVLLATADGKNNDWHAWIDNLANWFPDIPDGAILQGSLRLRFPKNKNSTDEARTALLSAFERGIPYYSAGVSWLLDGLTVFADDPIVERKMQIVQRVARRLDISQAFTVIRVSDKVTR